MGNPAGVRRKQRLKRRKKYEQRLGPGAYLPKELRAKLQAALQAQQAQDKTSSSSSSSSSQ
ncbi:MAG: hypothetical protein NZ703_02580 [Gemmataceae bacterium]|nr:hypothetical protein [Gemmataceae bacterium]